MTGLIAKLRRFRRDNRGSLVLEMALAIPVLAALLFSGVEVTRYVLVNQKIERTSATMSDLVSQSRSLSTAQLDSLIGAARHVMEPYDVAANGLVVVSSISNDGSGAVIDWQRTVGGGDGSSQFGAPDPSLLIEDTTTGSGAVIDWQHAVGGGDGSSRFGAAGSSPSLPGGFVVRDGENVIVAEVFYDYTPLMTHAVFEAQQVYNFAIFRPRYTTLEELES